jgi:antitoxin ParD1/3/4
MAKRTSMNVSLTGPLARFVNRQVRSGRYQTASEVVREGLRMLEERQKDRAAALAAVKRKIAVGLKQLDEGRVLDGQAVFERAVARLRGSRRKAG